MSFLLLSFYRFFPSWFQSVAFNKPHWGVVVYQKLYEIIKSGDIVSLMPYMDMGFLSALKIDLNAFSVILIERLVSNESKMNAIVVNVCSQLTYSEEDLNNQKKLEYWLQGENNWLYALADMSVSEGSVGNVGVEMLERVLDENGGFLPKEVLYVMQVSAMTQKLYSDLSYISMILAIYSLESDK